MKKQRTPESAYIEAASLCVRGEQCSSDILNRLLKWEIGKEDALAIVAKLEKERFIDNRRFAGAFARDKAHFQAWGKGKIRYHLRMKGIEQQIIDEALESIDTARYDDGMRQAILAKARSMASREPLKARASLYRFAASRGYDFEKAKAIINQCLNCDDEME
ncbi:MAG: regulatory protein RecX [Muribaculaceae bacterium]